MAGVPGVNIFECVNLAELKMKNLTPIQFEIGEQQEIYTSLTLLLAETYQLSIKDLEGGSVVVYDGHTVEYFKSVRRYNDVFVWFITEDSYTDNMDNDSFTYFKFKIINDC